MASTIETYEGDSKTHNVEDGQMKGSEDPTVNEVGGMDLSSYDFTEEESRAVARKFDLRILPWIFFCYLFNSLDRNNISNAVSDGMDDDLNFPKNGYSLLQTATQVPFCALVIPGVMLTRYIGPRWSLPGMMFAWGTLATCSAAVTNYAETVAVRVLLTACEAGFAASLIYYLTTFYQRGELGKRIAAFYSCQCLSGAFSGLLSYGVFQADSHLKGWQILFLLEGLATILFATIIFLLLPWHPSTARFLNEREKEVARLRILQDSSDETNTKFNLRSFFKPLKDWKYYVFGLIALCYGCGATVAQSFLIQIIQRFGYSSVKTNLYAVAPYVFGTITLACTAWSSDHFRERGLHLASSQIFVIIGCALLAGLPVTETKAAYFAAFMITGGAFTPSVLFHTWHQCNDPSQDGRAFRVGSFTFLANAAGLIASPVFKDEWAPKYEIPLIISCGIALLCLTLILSLRTYMMIDNRRRNKAQGVNWQSKDVPTEALSEGPKNPAFRHFY